jgi:hypothetical protein
VVAAPQARDGPATGRHGPGNAAVAGHAAQCSRAGAGAIASAGRITGIIIRVSDYHHDDHSDMAAQCWAHWPRQPQ